MLSGCLLALSLIYFGSRVVNFIELLESKSKYDNDAIDYNNLKFTHLYTIVHSGTCVTIATFVTLILNRNTMFQKKQYYLVLGLTLFVSLLYFIGLFAIVVSNTKSVLWNNPLLLIKSLFELLQSISDSTFSLVFLIATNFALISLIFCINMASIAVAELV